MTCLDARGAWALPKDDGVNGEDRVKFQSTSHGLHGS